MKLRSNFRWCLLGLMAFGYGHCESTDGDGFIEYGNTSPLGDPDFCSRIMRGEGPTDYFAISIGLQPTTGRDKDQYIPFYGGLAGSAAFYTVKLQVYTRPALRASDPWFTPFPPGQPAFRIGATQGKDLPLFFDKNGSSPVSPSYVGGYYTPEGNNLTTQGASCGSFVISFCDKPVDDIGVIIPAFTSIGADKEVVGLSVKTSRDFCILSDGSVKYTGNGTAPPLGNVVGRPSGNGTASPSPKSKRVPIAIGASVGVAAILIAMGVVIFFILRRRRTQNFGAGAELGAKLPDGSASNNKV